MFKVDLGKAEEPEQIANICWIIGKAREFQKNIYFCFIDYTKAFDCVDDNKPWEILKWGGNTRSPYLPPEKSVSRSRSKLELDMNNRLVPNRERSTSGLFIVILLI